MKIEILLTIAGLFVSVCVNLCAIAFFAGQMKAQQEAHKEQLKENKTSFQNTINEIKKSFKETVDDIKQDFKDKLHDIKENITEKMTENSKRFEENLSRLEDKQDKHNSVIERQFLLEKKEEVNAEQIKVVNHRIKDLEAKVG